jgi:hypothetical protein
VAAVYELPVVHRLLRALISVEVKREQFSPQLFSEDEWLAADMLFEDALDRLTENPSACTALEALWDVLSAAEAAP